MPGVDVVDDERAAPAAPVADPLVGRDRVARRVEPVADAERDADAEHEVAPGGLHVEDPLDRRPWTAARRRAPSRRPTPTRLGQGDAAGVAVAAGGGDLGPPPRDLPRLLGDEPGVGGAVRDRVVPGDRLADRRRAGCGRRAGSPRATRSSCSARRADVEVGAERAGDLLGEERARRSGRRRGARPRRRGCPGVMPW